MILLFLFLASGCSALIYEVTWIRLLRYLFGNTVYALSTILTVFMAGLALGSYLLGRLADRVDRPLLLYGALEFLIAVFALLFMCLLDPLKSFYVWIEHHHSLTYTSFSLVKFSLIFLVLIIPTTLMGGTLPAIARSFTASSDRIGRDVGRLYGMNVLGAVGGCLLSAFVLINSLGIAHTVDVAVAINAAIAAIVLILFLVGRGGTTHQFLPSSRKSHPQPARERDAEEDICRSRRGLQSWILFLSGLSGFATMGLEVLWTRTYISMLSANVLVFAVILAAFLTGLALGSIVIARWVDRIRDLAQVIAALLLTNSILVFASDMSLREIGGLFEYLHNLRSTSPFIDHMGVWIHFSVLFLIILIPTTAMGTVFPAIIRFYSRSIEKLGRDVGKVYTINTSGTIFGAFSSGFILIPLLGIERSIYLMAGIYAVLATATFILVGRRTLSMTGLAMVAACIAVIPSARSPNWFNAGFIRTRVIPPENTLFFKEGVSANVGIIQRDDFRALTVDGIIVAQNSRDDMWDLLLKAHLPMLLHPDPESVLLIGLGGGISLGAVEKYDVSEIDCVELSPEVVEAHRYFAEENDRCWEDPRLNLVINDGRHFLLTTEKRYDIISVDPVDPPVSTLYTRDFFQLCRDVMKDNGLMLQWVPLFRLSSEHVLMILNSFEHVFPNTTVWYDGTSIFLLGRNGGDKKFDYRVFTGRFSSPKVRRSLAKIDVADPDMLLATFVAPSHVFDRFIGPGTGQNTDDRPRLEYSVLRARGHDFYKNLELISGPYRCIVPYLTGVPEGREADRIDRSCALMRELLGVRILASSGRVNEAAEVLNRVAARYGLKMKDIERLKPFWLPILN
jgi:spermidine synthase